MKKIGLIYVLFSILFETNCQASVNSAQEGNRYTDSTNVNENMNVVIGNDLLRVEDGKDNIRVKVGNRGINIPEFLESSKFEFEKYTSNEFGREPEEENKSAWRRHRNKFRGHWSGIEFGFNNYVTADHCLALPEDIYYMSLNSGKSSNFNLNFPQLSLGFTKYIGIVTGLGLNWNNYRFDGNNNIIKGPNGIIEPFIPPAGLTLEKSKLTTLFLTLPVILEMQIPFVHGNHLYFSGGGIGALKLGSHTKMIYHEDHQKIKESGDFSLNMLRYGVTSRVGYGNLQLYGTYYMQPLFETGKGPELYPFEIGVALTFND